MLIPRIAFIPAKGKSQRLPRKNIVKFMNKPIILHTIKQAQKTKIFNKIVVSTNDKEIINIVKKKNIEISFRDKKLNADNVSVEDVCIDFLWKQKKLGNEFKTLTVLYPASPLRLFKDIIKVESLIKPGVCDFSMSATYFDLPVNQALIKLKKNKIKPIFPKQINTKKFNTKNIIVDNGSIYSANVNSFLKLKSFFGKNLKVHIMPKNRSVDINTVEDLEIAKFYAKQKK